MIKKSNPKIQQNLMKLKGGINKLIEALGYIDIDDDFYSFVGDHFTVLHRGAELINKHLNTVKVKYMKPEERKKHDIIE